MKFNLALINWANFYKGKFLSNTILNANAFAKLLK
ncbi:MAG: YoaP domain-containing protein [Bacilli bacterium]|nr:YoaP domain-containing protein [Bacilli bacterium]